MFQKLRWIVLACCATALFGALIGCSAATPSSLAANSASSTSSQPDTFANQVSDTAQTENDEPKSLEFPIESSVIAQQLEEQFAAIANSTSMNVSIDFVDLYTPANSCSFNNSDAIRSASTIKLMILYELLQQVSEGQVSLDEYYTLVPSDIVGGTGVLQGYGAGYTTTYRNLAELMINRSDNVATNVIINRIGMNNVNVRAAQLGLNSVALNRKMMDTAAIASGIDNYLSTADANTLLAMIYQGTFVNQEMSSFALSTLQSQTDNQGLLAGLPAGTQFAHKTGTLSNAQNDFGLVLGDHPYALAVFCEADGPYGSFSQSEAFSIMSRVAQCVSQTLAN